MNNRKRNYWPVASFCSLMIFINVTIFVILSTKLNFTLYATAVIGPIVFWPVFKYILDNTSYGKRIKKVWSSFPQLVHGGITLFCLFWSGYFIFDVILPFIKKDYAKDK